MADNTTLNAGTGGDTISTDDIGGSVKVQRVKVQYGIDGSATDVSDTNPLPVDDAGGSLTVDNAGTFAVQVDAALPAGTNAIGKLAPNSGVDIGDVDVLTQPARAATTDNVGAALMTDAIHNGTTALTPKFAPISAAASGNNTLVAAVTGKKIRVLSFFLVAAGAVDVKFQDGAGGTDLTGLMSFTTNSGISVPFSPVGYFETTAATLLNLSLSVAVQVSGALTYVEV